MIYDSGYEKCAHLYDLFDKKENVEFFLHYGLEAGEILDIGAGTGRIAIPLAEKGIKVFCIEPSPAMRREFLKKLSQRSDKQETHLFFEIHESGKLIKQIEERSLVGIIDRKKVHRLLSETGFEVKQEFNNYDLSLAINFEKVL